MEATPALLDDLLEKTSRTFALSVPRLPEPTRCEVTVAYLLFRVADTLEDATLWPPERKRAALVKLVGLLEAPSAGRARALVARWKDEPPCEHAGYRELLDRLPELVEACLELSTEARCLVLDHTLRTARLMAGFVEQERDHELRLESVTALRDYCYAVAGIVGEMLTELFLLDRPSLEGDAAFLRAHGATFGEALQLVNILKDAAVDATEGRRYLPEGCDLAEVFALARGDLQVAEGYVERLAAAGAPDGLVAFCALPVLLAWSTLAAVEKAGPGAKVARETVARLVARLDAAIAQKSLPALFEEVHERAC